MSMLVRSLFFKFLRPMNVDNFLSMKTDTIVSTVTVLDTSQDLYKSLVIILQIFVEFSVKTNLLSKKYLRKIVI